MTSAYFTGFIRIELDNDLLSDKSCKVFFDCFSFLIENSIKMLKRGIVLFAFTVFSKN